MRAYGLFLLMTLGWAVPILSAEPTPPHVTFVGIWDRSMPTVEKACRDTQVSPEFFRSNEYVAHLKKSTTPPEGLIFVLNLDASDAPEMAKLLLGWKEKQAKFTVIPLDKRGSQADLERLGLLTKDDTIIKYWRPNGAVNMQRMLQYTTIKYFERTGTVEPPILVPDYGYYDPDNNDPIATFAAFKTFKVQKGRWKEGAPTAVLVIQQSFWITQDLKVVDAEIRALEKEGANPVVVFGDSGERVSQLIRDAQPNLILEDRHGSMWGNKDDLEKFNIPYLRPISMLGSTIDEWQKDPRGMTARDIGMFMSLQESWGTVEPVVVGGLHANLQGFKLHDPIPERIDKFAKRTMNWAALHNKPDAQKKLAIIYYNKSLGKDDLMRGSPTGAFMDGPESLIRFLPRLKERGFVVENAPATGAALIEKIKASARNVGPWAQNELEEMVDKGNCVLVPLSKYKRWFAEKLTEVNRQKVRELHGAPPGKLMTVVRNGEAQMVIPCITLGNVVLMPQPERGEKQDEKLLHSRDVPPPHNYLAFYWWLEEEFKADAMIHWGTHGSLELLPGKENGLSKDCWSDICVGNRPVINLWIMDNLGEATLSRRRSYAELVDHAPPATVSAGINDAYKNLHEEIHKFEGLEQGLLRQEFRKKITESANKDGLSSVIKAEKPGEPLTDADIKRLDDHLHNLYEAATPMCLHILGTPPPEKLEQPYLLSILGRKFLAHVADARKVKPASGNDEHDADRTIKAEALEYLQAALAGKDTAERWSVTPDLEKDIVFAKEMKDKFHKADQEITGLLNAFEGKYITPGPGPDPIRNPGCLPGGRNLYSLNPEEIPTKASWEVARKLVDEMLKVQKPTPKKVGLDLNGMETMRDFGVMEGQILYLLGVRPVWNQNNLVVDVELIPAAELKRPRVDVFIAMGGMYKENFPTRVELMDKAVRIAAAANEEDNGVRLGTQDMEKRLLAKGFSTDKAALFSNARIFGTKPGNMSGTNILYLVPRSGVWEKDDEVADVYIDNMSFVYTKGVWGEKVEGLYPEAIQNTDTLVRVWASNMTSQLSNHHAYEYLGGLNMAVKKLTGKTPAALIADVRDPEGAKMRNFEEVLATNLQSELLNKNWVEAMKQHDYAGAGHMAELVKNTFGWSVTRPESVTQQNWNQIYDVYMKDSYNLKLNEWFDKVSPHAKQEMAATLLEASRKGLWKATQEQVQTLSEIYAKSVVKDGDSGGLVSGGNHKLADFTAAALSAPGNEPGTQLAGKMKAVLQKAESKPDTAKVEGQRMESVNKPKPPETAQNKPAESGNPQQKSNENAQAQSAPTNLLIYGLAGGAAVLLLVGFMRKKGAA